MASITVASIMKNEATRFLPSWLEAVTQFADRIVVADDHSTDGTAEMCEEAGCEVVRGQWGMQGNEWQARKALWDAAVPGSEWVVHIDADQIPAGDFRPYLALNRVAFVVYDLWDEDHYRCDGPWTGHERFFWHAAKVDAHQDHEWTWRKRGWHSGHLPANIEYIGSGIVMIPKECGLLHYGFATPELRQQQWMKYIRLGPHLRRDELDHVMTIKDRRPQLERLPFEPRWRLRWAGT